MLDFIVSLFEDDSDTKGIYLKNPRKLPQHGVYCYCADCDKDQPMATNCTCYNCGSKAIAVNMGRVNIVKDEVIECQPNS